MTGNRDDFKVEEEGQKGVGGAFERMLRRHKEFIHALTLLPIYFFASCLLALALIPPIAFYRFLAEAASTGPGILKIGASALGIGGGFFLFGLTLILVVPIANLPARPFVKPTRGQNYSNRFIGWYVHNSFTYLVRYTFLEFITPTPYNLFFFKRMGMRIGRDVQINSSNISDPALITLEDRVTIGGSASVMAHYGMGGFLILAPVIIRKGATLGLHAKVLGGCEIGEGAKVLPNSVVMPKTIIPAGETWGGVPARRMDPSDFKSG